MYKPFFNRGINDLSTSAPGLFSTNLISVNRWCFGDGIVHVWENGDEKGVKYFGIWVEKGFISLFAHEQRGVPIQISPWGNLGLIQNYLNYQSNHQVKSIGNQSVFGYVQKSQPNPTNPTQPNPTRNPNPYGIPAFRKWLDGLPPNSRSLMRSMKGQQMPIS